MMPTPISGDISTPDLEETRGQKDISDWKEARWRAYIIKTERLESKFALTFRRLLRDQMNEVLRNLSQGGIGAAGFDYLVSIDKFKKSFIPVIQLAYEEGYMDATKQADPNALEWIEERAAELVTGINATTRDRLATAIKVSLEEGEGVPLAAKRIKSFFNETYKGRAKTIARTEIIAANNEGALKGYERAGIEKAEFYTSLDDRTCEECEPLHGNVYPVMEAHGLIPVHPNCRCTYIPIV